MCFPTKEETPRLTEKNPVVGHWKHLPILSSIGIIIMQSKCEMFEAAMREREKAIDWVFFFGNHGVVQPGGGGVWASGGSPAQWDGKGSRQGSSMTTTTRT